MHRKHNRQKRKIRKSQAGEKKWFPCENLAEEEEDFVMNPDDFHIANLISDVIAIVHSHIHSSPEPSYNDIKYCWEFLLLKRNKDTDYPEIWQGVTGKIENSEF